MTFTLKLISALCLVSILAGCGSSSSGEAPGGGAVVPAQKADLPRSCPSEELLVPRVAHQISLRDAYGCAVTDVGVRCWGGEHAMRAVPCGLQGATKVVTGKDEACAIANGSVRCWTSGSATATSREVPEHARNVTDIAVSAYSACAIAGGRPFCWGLYEKELAADIAGAQSIVMSGDNACATTLNGVKCWGRSAAALSEKIPAEFQSGNEVKKLALGNFACGLHNSGKVKCWPADYAPRVPDDVVEVATDIAIVGSVACAISVGKVYCWNTGSRVPLSTPPQDIRNPRELIAGETNFCVRYDGGIACWGSHTEKAPTFFALASLSQKRVVSYGDTICGVKDGKLKCLSGSATDRDDLASLQNEITSKVAGVTPSSFSIGGDHQCALANNTPVCVLGRYASISDPEKDPSKVPAGLTNVSQLVTGSRHTCALTGGRVFCWGDNSQGALNIVFETGTHQRIFANSNTTCGMGSYGFRCWGNGWDAANSRLVFGQAPSNFTQIAIGSTHVCALNTNGLLTCGSPTAPNTTLEITSMGPFKSLTNWDSGICGLTDKAVICQGSPYSNTAVTKFDLVPAWGPVTELVGGTGICVQTTNAGLRCYHSLFQIGGIELLPRNL